MNVSNIIIAVFILGLFILSGLALMSLFVPQKQKEKGSWIGKYWSEVVLMALFLVASYFFLKGVEVL